MAMDCSPLASESETWSEQVYRDVAARESSARTYARTFATVFTRGQGSCLYDADGRRYIDCLAAAGTLALGHNPPVVTEAVRAFLDSGAVQQALDLCTPAKHAFIEELMACLPDEFARTAKIQFCGPTGSDAVEAAIKLFKTVTGRRTLLCFQGGYHGMTAGALSLTGNLTAKQHVPALMPDVVALPFPSAFRSPFGLGGEAGARATLSYIEHVLADPESGITRPAAMVLEVVQGEGGVVPAPDGWLSGLADILREYEVPLVIDEVQTGFGRTGHMFAFEAAGITPDAVIVSKAAGGGYPISAVLYHERFDRWQPGAHAGTFRGNQIAMVAGAATMRTIRGLGLAGEAARKGERLRSLLLRNLGGLPCIGEVRGRGLMLGVELVDPDDVAQGRRFSPGGGRLAAAIKQQCFAGGLLLETGGRHGSVVRFLPPLIVSDEEIDEIVEIFVRSVLQVTSTGAAP